ncbi:MAG: EthD domain-containing protein [Leptolyngbya sp. BL-A-14]
MIDPNSTTLTRQVELIRKLQAIPDEANWLAANADHLITRGYEVFAQQRHSKNAFLIKALLFLKRKPELSFAEVQRHWLHTNASLAAQVPGLLRYEQCHVASETYDGSEPTFDGVAELWWSDLEGFERSWSSTAMQDGLLQDLRSIFDQQISTGMLVYKVRMLCPWAGT